MVKIPDLIFYSLIHLLLVFIFLGTVIFILFRKAYSQQTRVYVVLFAFSLVVFSFYYFPHLAQDRHVPAGFNDGATHFALTMAVLRTWPRIPNENIPERRRIWAPAEGGKDLFAAILKTEKLPFHYPPGFYYLVATISKISGIKPESVFWFFPLLVNSLVPGSIFLFVSYLFRNKYSALLAGVLGGTTPFFIGEHFQGQYTNSLVFLLIPITLFLALRAMESKSIAKSLFAGLFLGFLVSVQSLICLLPVVIFLFLFWAINFKFLRTQRQAIRALILMFVVCAIFSFFWLVRVVFAQWKVFKVWATPVTFPGWDILLKQVNYLSVPLVFFSVFIFLSKTNGKKNNFLVVFLTFLCCWLVFQTGILGHYSWRRFFGYALLYGAIVASFAAKSLEEQIVSKKIFLMIITVMVFSLVQLWTFRGRFLSPDLISDEEFAAILWMRDNLPGNAQILTSQRAYVLTAAASGKEVSHCWFPSQEIAKVIERENSSQKILATIRGGSITHIYINRFPFVCVPDFHRVMAIESRLWDLPLRKIYEKEDVKIYSMQ